MKIKLLIPLVFFITNAISQSVTVQKSNLSVFSPVSAQDSCLISGGQVLAGDTGSNVQVGYFPLVSNFANLSEITIQDFLIYPNPFSDFLTFQAQNTVDLSNCFLSVYNSLGEEVAHLKAESSLLIDLHELSSGIYTILLFDGINRVHSVQVVKQ